MKKFLSLVLALIMVMSLVTVGAGAVEFADAEDIQYNEAVEVMTSLGILSGYENGYFAPNGTLSRGAAAKIAAYVALGNGAAMLDADEVSFPDVSATSSMAPYIAWAAENEIVNGYTNGNFGPKATVSGYAFLKMMLNVLGIEGTYTGTGWQVAVAAAAEDAKLFEGIDTDEYNFKEAASRELAAQIAFNAMKYTPDGADYWVVDGVKFDNATDAAIYAALISTDQNKVTPKKETDLTQSLAGKNYKLAVDTEVIIASTPETVVGQETTKTTDDAEYDYAASKELVGHVVNIYYKDADKDDAYDYSSTSAETVYAIVAQSTEVTVKKTTGLTYTQVESKLGIDIEKTTTTVKSNYTVENYEIAVADDKLVTTTAVKTEKMPTYEGLTINAGTYIIYNEELIGAKTTSSTVDAYTITINDEDEGYYTVTDSSENVVVKVAEDEDDCVDADLSDIDWLAIYDEDEPTVVFVTEKVGGYYSLSEVETVTGTITKIDLSGSTKYVYIDGTKYTIEKSASYPAAVEALGATKMPTAASVEFDEYVFYKNGDGKIFAYDTVDGSTVTDGSVVVPVYVYVKTVEVEAEEDEYGDVTNKDDAGIWYSTWIQCVDVNGEIVNLQVKDSSKTEQKKGDYTIETGKFYTYTTKENDDDEVIATLTKVVTGDTKGHDYVSADVSSTAKKVTASGRSYYLNDDFKVIYISGTGSDIEITVKDGTAAQIVKGAFVYGEKDEDATAYELKFVVVNKAASTTVTGEDIVYVSDELTNVTPVAYTDKDGKAQVAYEHTVYVDGVETPIKTKASQIGTGVGFYTYEIGEYDLWTLTEVKADEVSYVENEKATMYKNLITAGAAEDIDVTGATVINLVPNDKDHLGYDDVPTDATKLVSGAATVSFVYDAEEETVSVIYVLDYADQD